MSSDFGLPVDLSSKTGGLKAIANALNAGDVARAQIAAVLLGIPDRPPLEKGARSREAMIRFIRGLHWSGMIKTDWDPDKHPRWPAGAPDSQGGQFAPDADLDECGRNETARRRWMRHYGKDWPTDATGRRYDVHHVRARADGGTDEPENIEPMPHDEHVREHMKNGDFSRWAKRAWKKRKNKKKVNVSSPEAGTDEKLDDEKPPTSERG
ncbi:MAG TPA: HNH endonuclease signature motif containing protein [Rhizomicrobium sp.]|nr:HNH endonuclease signature motif containing protein [Rhizomicrobium sp.]